MGRRAEDGQHLGKIIRVTPDGKVPADSPFVGKPGVLPEIWAYGMRNPESLAYDPRTGRLWQNDHGPHGGNELNIVEKGKDYGLPGLMFSSAIATLLGAG